MMWLLIGIAAFWFLAYTRASLAAFTLIAALLLLGATLTVGVSELTWLVFAAIALPLNLRSLRQTYISRPILRAFRNIMPSMSSTEKEALEAGTTWWETDLFRGAPNWAKMHQFPAPRLTDEEQAFLDGPVETLCAMADDWQITHELADLPPEIWQYLKQHRFFAMIIKKEYGGLEFSAYAQSCVLKKLMGVSGTLASTVCVPNSLGPGELLQHYGTDEQKQHYLPRLACGDEIPCFALTSPEAGSDAGSIPDYGIVCRGEWQGQEVLGMRLTWNKRYITLAPIATVLGLAFKLRDPDQLLGEQEELGITCALIPTSTAGVEIGRRHFPLNVPFQNGPTRGQDVFVPLDYIIGGPEMAGKGWRMLVECLSAGRAISLPSNATGGTKSMAMATGAYARIRRQFKLPIGRLEGIEEPLARIAGNAYLMEAATTMSVGAIDLGEKPSVISAIVKYHMTDRAQKSVIDAMDIHGGKGICMGPNNYLARGYQGAPIAVTVEGANILTRSMIIYGQGAIRCHPFVLEQMNAAQCTDQREALRRFDAAMFGHVGFAISNFARALWLGLSGAHFAKSPFNDETKRYYQRMTRLSANLALMSDVAMAVYGGSLKRKERVSARLGDILAQLYLASATLKRFDDDGRNSEDLPLLCWAVEDALCQAENALLQLLQNFKSKPLGKVLKWLLLPWGRSNPKPSDRLDSQVARLMLEPGPARDRLGKGQYLTPDEGNPIGLMQQTMGLMIEAEAIVKRVSKARGQVQPMIYLDQLAESALAEGLISTDEAETLRKTEQGRLAVINVDDFDPAVLAASPQRANKPSRGNPKAA